jgi:two-component system sensor histidine kinase UhpB
VTLRVRLTVSILVALFVSFDVAAGLAWWHAARSVRRELTAAMEVGQQLVRSRIDDLAHSGDPARDLAELVRSFDGERHITASLDRPGGTAVSHPLVSDISVPAWFVRLVAPAMPPVRVALPPSVDGVIVMRAEPANEAGEAWAALGDSAVELLVFSALAGLFTLTTAGRALRPLARLATALDRVGPGNYGVRMATSGPPDVARLTDGFNRMGERLAAIETQNRRLNEQLLTMQDEERADLARDLHDEVGPFLFSMSVGCAAIDSLVGSGDIAAVPAQLGLLREDIGHVQKHVRAILRQLRPAVPLTIGLEAAIADIAEFWRARQPDVTFRLSVAGVLDGVPEAAQETAYRVVQEAISNAVRHSQARVIDVTVVSEAAGLSVRVADDGIAVPPTANEPEQPGFGIEGMRERVSALGGVIATGRPGTGHDGWVVTSFLPAPAINTSSMTGAC